LRVKQSPVGQKIIHHRIPFLSGLMDQFAPKKPSADWSSTASELISRGAKVVFNI
jgi:hypothetical protein